MKKSIIFSDSFKLTICTLIDDKFLRESRKIGKKILIEMYIKCFNYFKIFFKINLKKN